MRRPVLGLHVHIMPDNFIVGHACYIGSKALLAYFNLMSHAEASKRRAGRHVHRKLVDADAVIEIEKPHAGLHLHKQRFG